MSKVKNRTTVIGFGGVGIGVWWFVWGKVGFWTGLLYGIFWPVWVGFRLAEWLWR